MGKRSEKMYKNSPKLERGEDGHMEAKKPTEKSEEKVAGTEGEDRGGMVPPGTGVGVPVHARHHMERMDMHHKHQHEHHTHDHGAHGSKEEMHTRHEKEHKEMHSRHEKEMEHILVKGDTDMGGKKLTEHKVEKESGEKE